MTEIILASTSKTRRELLEKTGLVFKVEASDFDESSCSLASPEELVKYLALGKAQAVAQRNPTAVVIGADTVVFHQGKILGKPKDDAEARTVLKSYLGVYHLVYTGIAVVQGTKNVVDVVTTKVKIRDLSDEEIDNYVATKDPFGAAGAYTLQRRGSALIEEIQGDYYSVIGMPVFTLLTMLKEFNISLLK